MSTEYITPNGNVLVVELPAFPALEILHEDRLFIVVNKPSGLLSVPGRGPENQDSVVRRMQALYPGTIEQPSVHRLDMDTSGILVLARTRKAHRELSIQFQQRLVSKRYIAMLDGVVTKPEGIIDLPLKMDMFNRPYQVYDPIHGKPSRTIWRRLEEKGGRTRVEFIPITGRSHQLRMHASHFLGLGCPIVGDRLYGSGTEVGKLQLHAEYLKFRYPHPNPKSHVWLEFSAPPLF